MLNSWNSTLGQLDAVFAGLNDLRSIVERTLADGSSASFFAGSWPRLNLIDEGSRFVLYAEVPGMTRDDIKLTLTEDTLTMRGERGVAAPEGYVAQRQERIPVSFTRSVRLPCAVDLEAVSAKVRDGILAVSLDKAAQAKPRQISVASA